MLIKMFINMFINLFENVVSFSTQNLKRLIQTWVEEVVENYVTSFIDDPMSSDSNMVNVMHAFEVFRLKPVWWEGKITSKKANLENISALNFENFLYYSQTQLWRNCNVLISTRFFVPNDKSIMFIVTKLTKLQMLSDP